MKPETSFQGSSYEQPLAPVGRTSEHASAAMAPELKNNYEIKQHEKLNEFGAVVSDVGFTTTLPMPVMNVTTVDSNTTFDDVPLVANDDDLIEKEWVDKAKKIVAETLDNPHQRDEAVNKLQVDYLKKRYGREFGASE